MAFQDFLREAAPGFGGLLGGGLGAALGGLGGAGVGVQLGSLGGGLLGNLIPETETPFQKEAREAQLGLLQQLKQQPSFNFEPIRQQELRRFQEETLPGIAERFTGGQGSSAFQQALGRAGSDLGERLAALESGQQLQSQQLDLSRLGQLQNFLTGNKAQAAGQEAQRTGQLGQLLSLGQQISDKAIRDREALSEARLRALEKAGYLGITPQFESLYKERQPGFAEATLRQSPERAAQLAKIFIGR